MITQLEAKNTHQPQSVHFLNGQCCVTLQVPIRASFVASVIWPCSIVLLNVLTVLCFRLQQEPSKVSLVQSLRGRWSVKHVLSKIIVAPREERMDHLTLDGLAPVEGRKLCDQHQKKKEFDLSISLVPTIAKNVAVLELGSGTGIVGISASRVLGSPLVWVTDQEKCMELLQLNVAASTTCGNCKHGEGKSCIEEMTAEFVPATCFPLNWCDTVQRRRILQNFIDAAKKDPQVHCTWLVLCDCIYDPIHMERSPLVDLIDDYLYIVRHLNVMAHHHLPEAAILIALETRDVDIESAFFQQLGKRLVGTAGRKGSDTNRFTLQCVHEEVCSTPSDGNGLKPENVRYQVWTVA